MPIYSYPWGAYYAMEAEYLRQKKKHPKLTMKQFLKEHDKKVRN